MKKLLVFHPVIAPYRTDFFNDLYRSYDTKIVLDYCQLKSQKLNCESTDEILYKPDHLKKWFSLGKRDFYKGHFKYLKEVKPDIVAVSEYGLGLWSAIFYRIFSKNKYKIFTVCDDSLKMAQDCSGIRKFSRNMAIKHIDGVLLCNPQVEKWYNDYCDNNTFWFPIIHEDEKIEQKIRKSDYLVESKIKEFDLVGKKIFLYVGRLSPEKNLEYLVKSFIKASENQKDIVLILVGDNGSTNGEVQENIIKLINESKSQNIFLVGRKDGDELLAFYNLGQVFVLPSFCEAFGAVTGEALASGEYAMVSRNAGSSCLVDKNNGEVIDIDKEFIDFDNIISKIDPINLPWHPRKSKMPFSYKNKMNDLIKWIDSL